MSEPPPDKRLSTSTQILREEKNTDYDGKSVQTVLFSGEEGGNGGL